MLAKLLTIELDQPPPMTQLFHAHAVEDRSRGWKIGAQALDVVGVNAFVFFFEGNRERQYFHFRKAVKIFHAAASLNLARLTTRAQDSSALFW